MLLVVKQRRWRAKHARKLLADAIANVWQKIRDSETGLYFYYNTRTEESTWTKPKLLGSLDLHETFFLRPKDEVPLGPGEKKEGEEDENEGENTGEAASSEGATAEGDTAPKAPTSAAPADAEVAPDA